MDQPPATPGAPGPAVLPVSPPTQAPSSKPPRGASARRLRFGAFSLALALAILACVVLANVIASRLGLRLDTTASGDQVLAPRTEKILAQLPGETRVVVAAPLSGGIDRASRQRVLDVLSEMQRASGKLTTTIIDTSSATGSDQLRALTQELIARDADALRSQRATIEMTAAGVGALAAYLTDQGSPKVLAIRDQLPQGNEIGLRQRQLCEQAGAAMRLIALDMSDAVRRSGDSLNASLAGVALPATDSAASILSRSLSTAMDQIDALSREIGAIKLNETTVPEDARALAQELAQRRDQAGVLLDPITRLKKLDLLRVTDSLRAGTSVLIVGPPGGGLSAVDPETLFPSREWLESANLGGTDLGRRAEDLISAGLSRLGGAVKPVVVMLHADHRPLLEKTPLLTQLRSRLELRGIDVVEWACLTQGEPVIPRDGESKRPVVYVTLAPDTSAAAPAPGEMTGLQRAQRLGEVLEALSARGESLLLSVNPSMAPSFGEPDPATKVLAGFGVAAIAGKPLFQERSVPGQPKPAIDVSMSLTPRESNHPIHRAVKGLPTLLLWPIAFERVRPPTSDDDLSVEALYEVGTSDRVWGESQWLRWWQTRQEDRPLLPDQPAFDLGRDLNEPPSSPGAAGSKDWVVAVACERESPKLRQRVVAIGSNGWFLDSVTLRVVGLEGRAALGNPGNLELFEASVSWLAYQDDSIAQSTAGRTLPVVSPIPAGQVTALRWALMGALPMLTLLLALAYRLVRG